MEESFAEFMAGLAVMERWLQHNKAEAERWLPRLLELSGPDLSQEVARHPELQPGISRLLLEVVDDMAGRDPARAHELTTVVIEYAGTRGSAARKADSQPTLAKSKSTPEEHAPAVLVRRSGRCYTALPIDEYRARSIPAHRTASRDCAPCRRDSDIEP
jgi:hypothetical protein